MNKLKQYYREFKALDLKKICKEAGKGFTDKPSFIGDPAVREAYAGIAGLAGGISGLVVLGGTQDLVTAGKATAIGTAGGAALIGFAELVCRSIDACQAGYGEFQRQRKQMTMSKESTQKNNALMINHKHAGLDNFVTSYQEK